MPCLRRSSRKFPRLACSTRQWRMKLLRATSRRRWPLSTLSEEWAQTSASRSSITRRSTLPWERRMHRRWPTLECNTHASSPSSLMMCIGQSTYLNKQRRKSRLLKCFTFPRQTSLSISRELGRFSRFKRAMVSMAKCAGSALKWKLSLKRLSSSPYWPRQKSVRWGSPSWTLWMRVPAMLLRSKRSKQDYARLTSCRHQQQLKEELLQPQIHKFRHKSYPRMDTLLERGSAYTDWLSENPHDNRT